MKDNLSILDKCVAKVLRRPSMSEKAGIKGVYHVVCYDKDGNEKWRAGPAAENQDHSRR
jgi:hypothetical protein